MTGTTPSAEDSIAMHRRRAEHYRRQLETVANNATLALFIMDEQQHCTFMNPAAEHLTGFTLAEVQGRPLHEFVHHTRPDGRPYPLSECPIDRAFPTNVREQGEEVFVRKDGSFYPVAFTASPIREDGRTVGTIIEVQDISERRQAEQQMLRSARLLALQAEVGAALTHTDQLTETLHRCADAMRTHLDAAATLIWTLDDARAELVLQASAGLSAGRVSAVDRIGLADHQLGRFARELRPGHLCLDADNSLERDWEWARAEGIVSLAAHPLVVDDRVVGLMAQLARRVMGADDLLEMAGVANSIAVGIERKWAELARERALEQLGEETRTVETLRRVGLRLAAELDPLTVVQEVTDAATELTGAQFGAFFYNVMDEQGGSYMLYTLSGAPAQAFSSLPMPRNTEIFGPTFRGEGVVRSDDITRDPRYGKNPPYHGMPAGHLPVRSYLAVPVVSRTGEVIGGLFFGHSATGVFDTRRERLALGIAAHAAIAIENARLYRAEQLARQQAEEAVRARDEFLSIASHELRNPIAGLKAAAQVLLRWNEQEQADPERQVRFLRIIHEASERVSALLEDLLDVSRLRTGQLQLRKRPVDLAQLVREAVARQREQAPQHRIRADIPERVPAMLLDPDRIEQVLANVLSNAVRYSPEGGELDVVLGCEDDGMMLRVTDQGIGLPNQALESIFEPFGRAANAQEAHIPGMGLGLYICRQIVQSHGGRIWAESPGLGQGTTLRVLLPMTAESQTDE